MPDILRHQLEPCSDRRSVLECLLAGCLELTGTVLGNVQVMDWKTGCLAIAAQRGFNEEFLRVFRCVKADSGSACGRAIKDRGSVVIEDVLLDREFAPYRTIALEAGFRAVQSTPLISSSGAFLGVLSTHFPATHRPLDSEMRAIRRMGELAANAMIRKQVEAQPMDAAEVAAEVAERIRQGRETVERSYAVIRRLNAG